MDNVLGKRIKFLREERELSQLELAKILNISNSTLSQYEAGNRIPGDDVKQEIADFFEVSVDFLLGRTNIRNPYKDKEGNHTKSDELIEYVIEEAEKHGYNLKDKSKEEIAKIIVKALKIDEISKSN